MFHYGLTGGIGSGKSTVGKMFAENGVPVVDADQIAKKLLAPGTKLARTAAECFPSCANGSDAVDRDKLARLVFKNSKARRELEDLLHPAIWDEYLARREELSDTGSAVSLLEAAVILESRTHFPLAGVIVVVAPRRIRMQRLFGRVDLDQEQMIARMLVQLPDHEKLLRADYVINNHASLDYTRQQVSSVLNGLTQEVGRSR